MHSCSFFKQYITMKQMQVVKKYLTFPFVYSSYKSFFLSFAVQGIYSSDSLDKSMNYVGFGSAQTGFVLLCEVRLLQYPLLVGVSFCLLREVKSIYFFQPVYTLLPTTTKKKWGGRQSQFSEVPVGTQNIQAYRESAVSRINPLNPYIIKHIPHIVFRTFPVVVV